LIEGKANDSQNKNHTKNSVAKEQLFIHTTIIAIKMIL